MRRKKNTVVVFDLDETLGSFTQLGVLKDVIEKYENRYLSQSEFNQLIDENPEFIRPGIIDILKYAVNKRRIGKCDAIMIYTNNTGARSWAETIGEYFDSKVGEPVFDQIIAAYKINGRQIEPGRTTHDKTYIDFLRCTRLPNNTRVCFFDDILHPQMEHNNVFYINQKPYSYRIPLSVSLQRRYRDDNYSQQECYKLASEIYRDDTLRGESKTESEQEVDVIVGKYMAKHIKDFFSVQR